MTTILIEAPDVLSKDSGRLMRVGWLRPETGGPGMIKDFCGRTYRG